MLDKDKFSCHNHTQNEYFTRLIKKYFCTTISAKHELDKEIETDLPCLDDQKVCALFSSYVLILSISQERHGIKHVPRGKKSITLISTALFIANDSVEKDLASIGIVEAEG